MKLPRRWRFRQRKVKCWDCLDAAKAAYRAEAKHRTVPPSKCPRHRKEAR